MQTMVIVKERWTSFLRLVRRMVVDRPVLVEVEGLDLGDQEAGRQVQLRGVEYETKGSQRGDILLLLGTDQEREDHRVPQPEHMHILVNDAAQLECLELEDGEGRKTLIYFKQLLALPYSSEDAQAPS